MLVRRNVIRLNISQANCQLDEMLVWQNVSQAKWYIGEPVQGKSVQGETELGKMQPNISAGSTNTQKNSMKIQTGNE